MAKTAAQHAKTLTAQQLTCRVVRHLWADSTVDPDGSRLVVRQVCPNCESTSSFVVSANDGSLLQRRRMTSYGPGYLNTGGGVADRYGRGAYRLAWLGTFTAPKRKGRRK